MMQTMYSNIFFGGFMKKVLMVLFVLLIVAGVATAGGGRDQAAAQNSVSAYTTLEEPLARELFEQFERETGIRVNFVRLSGGEAVARMEAESANPQASIWVGGVGLDHITARDRNLTTPFVSAVTAQIPPEFRCPRNYWIGLYVGPLVISTNINRARELGITAPRSWNDLLNPALRGHIRMANPNTSGTAYAVITTVRYVFNENEDQAFDFLRRLDVNIDQYTRSGSAPGQHLAIGEIPIAIGFAHDHVRLLSNGAPIEIHAPSEGTGYELASMSLIRGGPGSVPAREAVQARQLYEWVINSDSAQRIFRDWYLVLIRHGAQPHPLALTLDQISVVDQDMAWDGDPVNRTRLLNRWTAEIEAGR